MGAAECRAFDVGSKRYERAVAEPVGGGKRDPGLRLESGTGGISGCAKSRRLTCAFCIKVSATLQRDHAGTLAKSNPKNALAQARKVNDPWFRAQALSWVARFTDGDPVAVASEAAKAARECEDDYKKSAVRSWEIAALAERDCTTEARKSLSDALALGKGVEPMSSRSGALFLLLQAAFRIGQDEAKGVYEILRASCPVEKHWRCKRAVRDGGKMIAGELEPRPFFW